MTDNDVYLRKPLMVHTDLKPYRHVQRLYRFANGYGASVVQGEYTYGGKQGLWEMAVLDWPEPSEDCTGWDLTYETPITDDVLGWLTEEVVAANLDAIERLPRNPKL